MIHTGMLIKGAGVYCLQQVWSHRGVLLSHIGVFSGGHADQLDVWTSFSPARTDKLRPPDDAQRGDVWKLDASSSKWREKKNEQK